jgi:predicted metal-dependent phosphoesterase TrpH
MAGFVDLHIHTLVSDGTLNCAQLLEEIHAVGIGEFAITDHDRLGGTTEMAALLSGDRSLTFHNGVELSVSLAGREYHLTAYDFDPGDPALLGLLEDNLEIRRKCDIELIREVAEQSAIDVVEFKDYRYDRSRGGWNSLNYLIDRGVIADLAGFVEMRSRSRAPLAFDSPRRAIAAVHAAGGYICLAHPAGYRDYSVVTAEQLDTWKAFGIDGIECYAASPDLTTARQRLYLAYCRENGLYITGGSDYHGAFGSGKLGVPPLTEGMLNLWPRTPS